MEQEYYTQSQYAKALGVTPVTIWRWVKEGKVKTVYVNGKRMIPKDELKPKDKEK